MSCLKLPILFILALSLASSVSAVPSIQVRLVLNSTSSRIFLPGTGQLQFSDLPTAEAEYHPQDYFLASYLNNQVKGIVFSAESPSSLLLMRNSTHHFLGSNLSIQRSQVFLVFTKGDYKPIESRIHAIKDKAFLSHPLPSFSFGLGRPEIKMVLNYSNIDLTGSFVFRQGVHELTLESNRSAGRSLIIINETIR